MNAIRLAAAFLVLAGYAVIEQKASPRDNQRPAQQVPHTAITPIGYLAPDEKQQGPQSEAGDWREAVVPSTFSSWAVVIVGLLGVLYAIRTLKVIRDQTDVAKKAADAALSEAASASINATAANKAAKIAQDTAEVLINSERAWVMAELKWPRITEPQYISVGATSDRTAVALHIRNEGRTPAWITETLVRFDIVDRVPDEPPFDAPCDPAQVIHKYRRVPLSVAPMAPETWYREPLECPRGSETATYLLSGFVRYEDIFGKSRQTIFGYYLDRGESLRGHQQLTRVASPKYNKAT